MALRNQGIIDEGSAEMTVVDRSQQEWLKVEQRVVHKNTYSSLKQS